MPKKKTPTIDLEKLHRSEFLISSSEGESDSDSAAFSKFLAERKAIRKQEEEKEAKAKKRFKTP